MDQLLHHARRSIYQQHLQSANDPAQACSALPKQFGSQTHSASTQSMRQATLLTKVQLSEPSDCLLGFLGGAGKLRNTPSEAHIVFERVPR